MPRQRINIETLKDYRGVTWTQGPDGYLVPTRRSSKLRSVRLQRTIALGLLVLMFVAYVVQMFVYR